MLLDRLELTETLTHGKIFNGCQHDRVEMVFKHICVLVLVESGLSIGRVKTYKVIFNYKIKSNSLQTFSVTLVL